MSTPRTVTVTTTTTKTIGQIAYEASGDVPRVGSWGSLPSEDHRRWERIAEAVAKALDPTVHVPAPVSVGGPSCPFNISGRLVPAPRPGDPAIPETWPRSAPWMTLGKPETEPPCVMKPWDVFEKKP
jgi:hypothetical protein